MLNHVLPPSSPRGISKGKYIPVTSTRVLARQKHFMMAGASAGLIGLSSALRTPSSVFLGQGPCSVFNSDVRLRALTVDVYTLSRCARSFAGKIEIDPRQQDTVMNPQLIVEVWSDKT